MVHGLRPPSAKNLPLPKSKEEIGERGRTGRAHGSATLLKIKDVLENKKVLGQYECQQLHDQVTNGTIPATGIQKEADRLQAVIMANTGPPLSNNFLRINFLENKCKSLVAVLHNRPHMAEGLVQTDQQVFRDLLQLLQENNPDDGKDSRLFRNKSKLTIRDIVALRPGTSFLGNLSGEERRALGDLRSNKDFLIKEADKGGNVVLWPHSLYLEEAHRQLGNDRFYKKLPSDPTAVFAVKFRHLLERARDLGIISHHEFEFMWVEIPVTATFYMLPKIHNDSQRPPGRPIVAGIGSLCEKACMYVDHFLQPLTRSLPSFVLDTSHFIRICREVSLPPNFLLVTCDVESLYSNISHDDGITATLYFLDQLGHSDRMHDSLVVDLLEFIMRHNFFLFDRTYYLQVSGVAMGARCAPAVANLFLGWWEATMVYPLEEFKRHVCHWSRYIDDLFFIWTGSIDECRNFITSLNRNSHNIVLTYSFSSTVVTFLDLQVMIRDGSLHTKLFRKPTATNCLLDYRSFHPMHTRNGVPVGQFLRTRRNCTSDEDFHQEALSLTNRFRQRHYPRRSISVAFQRANSHTQESLLVPQNKHLRLMNWSAHISPDEAWFAGRYAWGITSPVIEGYSLRHFESNGSLGRDGLPAEIEAAGHVVLWDCQCH
ncbi:unnamed protein product [Ranitomeya imitator]|uniref:Reverse transcriptase domain-containing protein n=1 Tax=Ranitomeya imitator TaxID=111125 RepID=A0ABN9MCC2_9NEOB|nr:unnamed protein product [Ranitomeya imitator]